MNFPSQVKTRSVVILLACMLFVSSVSIYYGLSASTPTSGLTDIYIEPPLMEPSYIIGYYNAFFDVNTLCYLKNGTTGQVILTDTFTTCLQTAVNALKDGGKIKIRSGTYYLTTSLTIMDDAIFIEGEGPGNYEGTNGTKIKYYLPSINFMVYYQGLPAHHCFFGGLSQLTLEGNLTVGSYGIGIAGYFSDLIFEDVGIWAFGTGVYIESGITGSGKVWNIWFSRCFIESNLNYGIYFHNSYDSVNRYIDRVKISECHFSGNKNSIFCDTPYVYHVSFADNTVEMELQSCINATTGGRQWIISNNHIFDCGIGANETMAGIYVNGTGTAAPDSWLIEGNVIANNRVGAMNNSIWLTGTCRNFAITNNYLYSVNTTLNFAGLNTTIATNNLIINNLGYVTANSGVALDCVNGSWIAHGLAGDPDLNGSITVSLRGGMYFNATILYMVPTIIDTNATHFQLQFLMWKTVAWTIHEVGVVEKAIVFWDTTYKLYL